MSIVSLNLKMPFAFITPFTPSGILYAQSATPNALVVWRASLSGCPISSEVSATKTRPSSLIVSTRAGTTFYRDGVSGEGCAGANEKGKRTKRLDRQIIPMKLLL